MSDPGSTLQQLRSWPRRRWAAAAAAAALTVGLVGVPTDLVNTPLFSRAVPPTWWSWPVLVVTAVATGLLGATYVAVPGVAVPGAAAPDRSPSRLGSAGGVLTYFAVGCPVCNKLVLLAVGSSGALHWFEPVQPVLAFAGLILLGWALRARLRAAQTCPVPSRARS